MLYQQPHRGVTPKSLASMAGFVAAGPRANNAGYLNELIDTLKFESNEQVVVICEYAVGRWQKIGEV